MKSKPYAETLSESLDNAFAELKDRGAVIAVDIEQHAREMFGDGGIRYNETRSANIPLVSYKGKATKKAGHITIYRMESGRYEQTNYIL